MNIAEKIAEFFLHARQTAEMLPDGSGTVAKRARNYSHQSPQNVLEMAYFLSTFLSGSLPDHMQRIIFPAGFLEVTSFLRIPPREHFTSVPLAWAIGSF